jgi:hypothetical protein
MKKEKNKEEKNKKEIQFNLADYDYMDSSMRIEGWVWEFLRRNKNYIRDYKTVIDKIMMADNNTSDGLATVYSLREKINDRYRLRFMVYERLVVAKMLQRDIDMRDARSVRKGVDIKPSEIASILKGIPDNKYKTFFYNSYNTVVFFPPDPNMRWPEILRDYKNDYFSFDVHPIIANTADGFLKSGCDITSDEGAYNILNSYLVHRNQDTTLYMSIDLSSHLNIEQITDKIRKEIVDKKKELGIEEIRLPKTPKSDKNEDKNKKVVNYILGTDAPIWKSYLIVYDLIREGMSNKEAGTSLSTYDDSKAAAADIYGAEKTIERHYKAAEKMINGGYKKYL